MNLPDLDQLKKIIELCRKTGVKTFTCGEMTVTLSDYAPQSKYKRRQMQQDEIPSDVPSDAELLMWSAPSNPE